MENNGKKNNSNETHGEIGHSVCNLPQSALVLSLTFQHGSFKLLSAGDQVWCRSQGKVYSLIKMWAQAPEHMLSGTGGGRGYFVVNLNSSHGTGTVHIQISVLGAVSLHWQPPSWADRMSCEALLPTARSWGVGRHFAPFCSRSERPGVSPLLAAFLEPVKPD